MDKCKFAPVHPGVVLAQDSLRAMNISQSRRAKGIGIAPRHIRGIVRGRRRLTADIALRIGKFICMEAQFWMNLQMFYEMEVAKDAISGKLEREVKVFRRPDEPINVR